MPGQSKPAIPASVQVTVACAMPLDSSLQDVISGKRSDYLVFVKQRVCFELRGKIVYSGFGGIV